MMPNPDSGHHVPVTGLRRSVLAPLRRRDGSLDVWPPDADAVPDAVILDTSFGEMHLPLALDVLGYWRIDCILDIPPEELSELLVRVRVAHVNPHGDLDAPLPDLNLILTGITSLLCRDPSVEDIRQTESAIVDAEREHGLPAGAIAIELFVTAPRSFLELDELLAASDRVVSVITDPAALAQSFRVEPSVEVDQWSYPRGRLVLAAAHRRFHAVGLFAPAGHHRIAAAGMDPARFSFAIGLHGGLCRTWAEVRACNRGFTPDEERVARARRIIEAMEQAGQQGLGAISLDGRMIDIPFITVSQATLRLAEQAAARAESVRILAGGG